MNDHAFTFHDAQLHARPSGALWWRDSGLLCVSDLHLGKSGRLAARGGPVLPPYDTQDTLTRLEAELDATGAHRVIALGDSFDGREAVLAPDLQRWLTRMIEGRGWIWIAGNHDPVPSALPGAHVGAHREGALVFRHIASAATGEVSGHYHPKVRLALRGAGITRPCFLIDTDRIVMPAFGTYTGGLDTTAPELSVLMGPNARAVLTGTTAHAVPMPRGAPRRRSA